MIVNLCTTLNYILSVFSMKSMSFLLICCFVVRSCEQPNRNLFIKTEKLPVLYLSKLHIKIHFPFWFLM